MSIRFKLSLMMSLLGGAVALFVFLYVPARIESLELYALGTKEQILAKMAAASVAPAVVFDDEDAAHEALRETLEDEDVAYVIVEDGRGHTLTAYEEDRARIARYHEASASPATLGSLLRIGVPIESRDRDVGRLYMGLSTGRASREISRARRTVGIVSVFFFACGVAASFAMSARLTRPLRGMVDAAERIRQGDIVMRAPGGGSDEVGQLGVAFNTMVDHLASAQRALEEMNRTLEQRVEERTTALSREVDERRRAEAALRASEERYALAAQGANDGLWDWNLRTDALYVSPRWKSMLGLPGDAVIDGSAKWWGLIHPDDLAAFKSALAEHLEGRSPSFESEHRVRHSGGGDRWMHTRGLAVRDPSGRAERIAGSQTDVTSRKRVETQLVHDAFHDALTRLPNRTLFLDRLEHAMARSQRHQARISAVMFLDLDRFKIVNDGLGHAVGDQLLVELATRLKACLRPMDTVARLGGDEFAILLEDIKDVAKAKQVVDRIFRTLEKPFVLSGRELFTTASLGIALTGSGTETETAADVLRNADTAMYRAKGQGRNSYQVFDERMHAGVVAMLQIENDLRHALERAALAVYYQPIIRLSDSAVIGLEALVRWPHPARGLVSPADFIPVAEDTGLIVPLDQWVLGEACRQLAAWRARGIVPEGTSVSSNVSSRAFNRGNIVATVESALAATAIPPSCLKVEITESAIIDNPESAKAMLEKLKGLGVHLSIDDFGTGYSSLSYLHSFPFDNLKIDRAFVARMGPSGENWEIVHAIINIANSLRMEVIAEGIETAEQYQTLQSLGCDAGQGYYMARPMPADGVEEFLRERS